MRTSTIGTVSTAHLFDNWIRDVNRSGINSVAGLKSSSDCIKGWSFTISLSGAFCCVLNFGTDGPVIGGYTRCKGGCGINVDKVGKCGFSSVESGFESGSVLVQTEINTIDIDVNIVAEGGNFAFFTGTFPWCCGKCLANQKTFKDFHFSTLKKC